LSGWFTLSADTNAIAAPMARTPATMSTTKWLFAVSGVTTVRGVVAG
jgi:hypothetical protein